MGINLWDWLYSLNQVWESDKMTVGEMVKIVKVFKEEKSS